jgi:ribosomal protein S18 acetylase RimI-like enzyme
MTADRKWVIRPAGDEDVPAMISLRREAEAWLARAGIDQWSVKWQRVADEKAARAARQQRAWVLLDHDNDDIAATVTLGGPDEDLWHPSDGPALYLYKLIVARRLGGLGLGALVLDWACDQAARWGYPWLRLDAWPSNPALLSYYRAHGFTDVRIADVSGRDTGALMQRPAHATPTPNLTQW